MDEIAYILATDIEQIKDQLEMFSGYVFSEDLNARMKTLGISKSALGERIGVSHTTVNDWLNTSKKPNGKERYKALGMALGMDAGQLNSFLLANSYPRLYSKNPLDAACRVILSKAKGEAFIVRVYNEYLESMNYDSYTLQRHPKDIYTTELSRDLDHITSVENLDAWLQENSGYVRAFDKDYIPHKELISFILLHTGKQTINDMHETGELPITIRNLLYQMTGKGKNPVQIRPLRVKLIVFGLYQNMNEDEIDIMLDITKLQPLTEPLARVDQVLLTALRCAHERYPYYELNNAEKMLKGLAGKEMPVWQELYRKQRDNAESFVEYYETTGRKDELDRKFEE